MRPKRDGVPPMWPLDDGSYRIIVRRRGKKHAEAVMERKLRYARKQLLSRTRKPKA